MAGRIDPLRVATDRAYAGTLSPAEWEALDADPEWAQFVAEQPELVGFALGVRARRIPGLWRQPCGSVVWNLETT